MIATRRGSSAGRTVLADIEAGRVRLEAPAALADRWVTSGALLLNSALTLSRFDPEIGPHQARGHLPLWRPVLLAVLRHLAARRTPLTCVGFGDTAASLLREAGLDGDEGAGTDGAGSPSVILRPHPAAAGELLALKNPFSRCNRHLEALGAPPIDW